ncbi:serine hydrolase domain-containing protein [Agromyces bauzanensis]
MTSTRPTNTMILLAAIAVATLTTLTACTAGSTVAPTEAPPGSSSADASLESAILPVLTEQMEELQVPGLVAIIDSPDRGTYEVALGVADVDTEEPMRMDDHFRVGSNTKTMTATVILQLADEGKLALDDPLAPYFPGVDTNGATLRQALNMTSGIPTYTTDPFLNGLADAPQRVWTADDLFATIAGQPPEFAPGAGWDYSNTNYLMLALIAEQVGGASLGDLITERVFAPLGMTGCSLPQADDATLPSPFSRGYQYGTKWDEPSPPADLPALVDVTDFNPSWGFGAGEAICTAADMAIWAEALVTGELLSPEMQAERLEFVQNDVNFPYGLGIGKLNGLVGHNGHMSGYMTQATVRESDGTVIVVLTNITQAPGGALPATNISEWISRAIPAD